MSKKLTTEQIQFIAKDTNIPYAALRAVIEVEAKGSGFNDDGLSFNTQSHAEHALYALNGKGLCPFLLKYAFSKQKEFQPVRMV